MCQNLFIYCLSDGQVDGQLDCPSLWVFVVIKSKAAIINILYKSSPILYEISICFTILSVVGIAILFGFSHSVESVVVS